MKFHPPCTIIYDHTTLKALVLIRSLKLSNIGPGLYLDPLTYFPFHPVLHDLGTCYPICGMVHVVVAVDFLSHYLSGPLP